MDDLRPQGGRASQAVFACPGGISVGARTRRVLLSGPLIAIADRDEGVRAALGSLVESLGYNAVLFPSVEALLACPDLGPAVAAIIDVRAPGLRGDEVKLWMTERNLSLPLIMITSGFDRQVRLEAVKAGAVCLLRKPFEPKVLVAHLRDALRS